MNEPVRLDDAIAADFAEIDRYCDKIETQLVQSGLEKDIFAVQLILREALTNAVVHGCGKKRDLRIGISFQITDLMYKIEVTDPGTGFDWQDEKGCSRLDETSGRGLCIIRKYADRIGFNQSGNSISIEKDISEKEQQL